VSEDHPIMGQRITRNPTDTKSLEAMVEQLERRCKETPRQVSADSGFYRNEEIQAVMARGADVYVPDSNMAQEPESAYSRLKQQPQGSSKPLTNASPTPFCGFDSPGPLALSTKLPLRFSSNRLAPFFK
jgi:hypothetical protein